MKPSLTSHGPGWSRSRGVDLLPRLTDKQWADLETVVAGCGYVSTAANRRDLKPKRNERLIDARRARWLEKLGLVSLSNRLIVSTLAGRAACRLRQLSSPELDIVAYASAETRAWLRRLQALHPGRRHLVVRAAQDRGAT